MVSASQSCDCSSEWDINSAAGSPEQAMLVQMLWGEECCSNLIMNLGDAYYDPLQPAVLDARMLLGCFPGLAAVLKRKG